MTGTIAAMQRAANELEASNIGYDQNQRWSFFQNGQIVKNKEADCSSLCGAIVKLGGYNVNLADPFYTGSFRSRLVAAGFTAIRFSSLSQVRTGDFLLKEGHHVEFAYTATTFYSDHIDEHGNIVGGAAGDQGNETSFRQAYNYSGGWDYILRPPADPAKKSNDQIANEVIAGNWGNGDERKNRLAAAGYNPTQIQALVNQKLAAPAKKSVSEIATEVIQGKWGNGDDRVKRLTAAGYDAKAVQAEVNRRL